MPGAASPLETGKEKNGNGELRNIHLLTTHKAACTRFESSPVMDRHTKSS
jgi:hypothetical protein